ncbi:MAG: DNA translocase FtsK 4TM domain-containing protein, partial [Novosphingobium sp.]
MATQAIGAGRRPGSSANWRVVMRRAVRRSSEMGAAILLLAGVVFLALALVSYHQTDPSPSTAAGGVPLNWMGAAGAWAADAALLGFGLVSVLFLPLMFIASRKLWHMADDIEDAPLVRPRWRTLAVLLCGMVLLSTVLSLTFTGPGLSLPATMGGLSGLLGAKAVRGAASFLPHALQGWAILLAALACLASGAVLAGRVFMIDWAGLLTMPQFLRRSRGSMAAPSRPKILRKAAINASGEEIIPEAARRSPQISDPAQAVKPAALGNLSRQGDLFDTCELPGLELLADAPPYSGAKVDKLSLERNARLLETVLDDFNVKGEITAVRTGPVITMYELEPAPGIKASRVIGLADDIARNMSAISARVCSIPGRTVMGIEL